MPNGNGYPADSPQAMCARDHLTLAMVQRDFFTNAMYGAGPAAPARGVGAVADRRDLGQRAGPVVRARDVALPEHHVPGGVRQLRDDLLRKVTYNPAMGNYLDMVNNDRARRRATAACPNENYAREIMQLFSIGLIELKRDGTPLLDAHSQADPDLRPDDIARVRARLHRLHVRQLADRRPRRRQEGPLLRRADGAVPDAPRRRPRPERQDAARTARCCRRARRRSRTSTPRCATCSCTRTPAPFVGKQLIQRLVTGNPSPAYVQRVAAGVQRQRRGRARRPGGGREGDPARPRGARPAKADADFGTLREPVLMVTGLLRALNGVTDGNAPRRSRRATSASVRTTRRRCSTTSCRTRRCRARRSSRPSSASTRR